MSSFKCILRSLERRHDPIELIHGREVTFGRGTDSKIYENRCSRKQLKVLADCEKREVKITQLGRNPSALNGIPLTKEQTVIVKEGDKLELLIGQFAYTVDFNPPREATSRAGHKRGVPTAESSSMSREYSVSDSEEEGQTMGEPRPKKNKTQESEENVDNAKEAWESVDGGDLLVYTHPDVKPSSLIAGYDLDWTLIRTKTGMTFPKNKDDWKFSYPSVLPKLKEMHEQNFKIVIFTNQATVLASKTTEANFKSKIENIISKMELPAQLFVATGHSFYRKPTPGMWEALKERNGGLEIDMERSFFCGDAAGREAVPNERKKDFSQGDLLFAKNLNLRFETPEYHFLKMEMPPLKTTVFDPNNIPCDIPLCNPSWGQVMSSKLEVIILVGSPGSGKSHFVKTHLLAAGYVHVNRDTLGSWQKCVSVMESALKSKQKVVVDATNPDVESRRRYIVVAKNYTALVRCFIIDTGFEHAKHNNRFRQLTDPSHAIVTNLVMNSYKAKYKEPTVEEGFTEVLKINFWPTFKDPKLEKLYKMYLLEK